MYAQFLDRWGMATYYGPQWDTADRVIPWKLFLLLWDATWSMKAGDQLDTSRGINLAFAGDQGRDVMDSTRKLARGG